VNKTIEIGPHPFELSSLDKIMFPDDGIDKGDLIDYYRRIAETMLPHLLAGSELHAQSYTINNIFRRLGQKTDPWAGMMQHAQSLTTSQKRLAALAET
jgi:DNA primase